MTSYRGDFWTLSLDFNTANGMCRQYETVGKTDIFIYFLNKTTTGFRNYTRYACETIDGFDPGTNGARHGRQRAS